MRTQQQIGQTGFAGGGVASPIVTSMASPTAIVSTSTVPTAPSGTSTVGRSHKPSTLHLTKPIFAIAAVLTILHFLGGGE